MNAAARCVQSVFRAIINLEDTRRGNMAPGTLPEADVGSAQTWSDHLCCFDYMPVDQMRHERIVRAATRPGEKRPRERQAD